MMWTICENHTSLYITLHVLNHVNIYVCTDKFYFVTYFNVCENHTSLYITLHVLNHVNIYVCTDKFYFVTYFNVDGRARKCI